MTDWNDWMELIGGPFDGARGPCRHAGEPALWIRSDSRLRGVNGLLVTRRRKAGFVKYTLYGVDDHGDVVGYVFASLDPDRVVLGAVGSEAGIEAWGGRS